jgi:hypothetical protein
VSVACVQCGQSSQCLRSACAAGEYLSFSASVYLDCPAEQMFQCTADKNKEVEARGSLPSLSLSLSLFQW